MRWYVNDASLQGQFADALDFEHRLRQLLTVRDSNGRLRATLCTMHGLPERLVSAGITLRNVVQQSHDQEFRRSALTWLDRTGPFIEDDRLYEPDDYFEYFGIDVTHSGLGEAARRVKAGDSASTFSFEGGDVDFMRSPLSVDHGLPEERFAVYTVTNVWTIDGLNSAVLDAIPPATSWQSLVEVARERFLRLVIPDSIYENRLLAREPFSSVIARRALALLGYLDSYMAGRLPDGSEGPHARDIVGLHFTGDRAHFTGESVTNQRRFTTELTFADPENDQLVIFAHWHGKISSRTFRLHFEWPVPVGQQKLKVLYLGPKITKD